jgi:large subunit ribosomal protein L6
MSRIGKAPITLPQGVTATINGNVITVKGKKGELSQVFDRDLKVEVQEGVLTVSRPTDQKRHKAMHGLYRALINNIVVGVSDGYRVVLELVGVGFRATATGQLLEMQLGFSHPVVFLLPNEIKISAEAEKGKAPRVILESNDKQLLGQVAARIRSVRKPEPYKGKGIRFENEVIRRKEGKSASKK